MDAIFKALADPARRDILDALREEDGQTLSQLGTLFEMTRFGVMKHLGVLEDAGLITTVKRGRYKYHYLNALPLQEVIDRWIAPIAKPAAREVLELKAKLEAAPQSIRQTAYIAAPRAAVWEAITSAELQNDYNYMADHVTRESATLVYYRSAIKMLSITETAREDGHVLHARFEPAWAPNLPISDLTYRLFDDGPHTKLILDHRGLGPEHADIADGWARTLAGLKTHLETGGSPKFRAPPG